MNKFFIKSKICDNIKISNTDIKYIINSKDELLITTTDIDATNINSLYLNILRGYYNNIITFDDAIPQNLFTNKNISGFEFSVQKELQFIGSDSLMDGYSR